MTEYTVDTFEAEWGSDQHKTIPRHTEGSHIPEGFAEDCLDDRALSVRLYNTYFRPTEIAVQEKDQWATLVMWGQTNDVGAQRPFDALFWLNVHDDLVYVIGESEWAFSIQRVADIALDAQDEGACHYYVKLDVRFENRLEAKESVQDQLGRELEQQATEGDTEAIAFGVTD